MKLLRFSGLLMLCVIGAIGLFACGGATPTAVPPTTAPTAVPPTPAPTLAPTTAPTMTPTAAPSENASAAVLNSFKKFGAAKNFRLKANVETLPEFFQLPYQPGPNDDPNNVKIVTLDGVNHASDIHYTLGGFLGSFVGALSGFAPTNPSLEIIIIGSQVYMRGILDGQTAAQWYLLPESQAGSMGFDPQDVVRTITETDYAQAAFEKTGTASMDGQTCDVYRGDRAAFEAALPRLIQEAGLNAEEIDAAKLTKFDFQVTVCPDGNVAHIVYNFEGPVKSKPTVSGKFNYDAQLSGFADTLTIQAPSNVVPMPEVNTPTPTEESLPEATLTPRAATTFTSLEGDWEGTNSSDSPIQFTVTDGKITYAGMNYAISSGDCLASGFYGSTPDDGAIQDQNFTVLLTNSDGVRFILAGIFDSDNQAHGTLNITGKTHCGDTDTELTWTATHVSAPPTDNATPDAEPTAEMPTEAPPTPTDEAAALPTTAPLSTDDVALVQSVFDALNQGDVNTAMTFFDENVIYNLGSVNGIGADGLKNYLQLGAAAGAQYSVSNVQSLDGIVSFALAISGPGAQSFPNSSVIIQDGKIALVTLK